MNKEGSHIHHAKFGRVQADHGSGVKQEANLVLGVTRDSKFPKLGINPLHICGR